MLQLLNVGQGAPTPQTEMFSIHIYMLATFPMDPKRTRFFILYDSCPPVFWNFMRSQGIWAVVWTSLDVCVSLQSSLRKA